MAGKKLEFSVDYGADSNPVKARLFRGVDGSTYANIHGDLFNDCEISMRRLDQLISLLSEVREAARDYEGGYARTT